MEIIVHFFISAILAGLLFLFFGWYSLLAFVGGVLIDIDHYILYFFIHKNFNLKKAYYYFKDRNFDKHYFLLYVFHSMELLIVMIIISFYNKIILIITLGMALHYAADFIYELQVSGHFIKNWWTITWLRKIIKKNNEKKKS